MNIENISLKEKMTIPFAEVPRGGIFTFSTFTDVYIKLPVTVKEDTHYPMNVFNLNMDLLDYFLDEDMVDYYPNA